MTSERDRRRFERYSTDGVDGSFSYSVEASVLNISVGGFAVRTRRQLHIGRKYRFRLGSDPQAVQLAGAVRWCRMSGTEKKDTGDVVPVYEAGIAFENILSHTADELLGFMERNVILDLSGRVFGRFSAGDQDTVKLEGDCHFVVKQLSVSGMMVEGDMAPKPDDELELQMRLGQREFNTPARIIHVAETNAEGNAVRYRIGLEFVRTAPEQVDILQGFILNELQRGPQPTEGAED